METWLKWLIAAACCVVIAGGGYFTWSKYEQRNARIAYEQRLASAKVALFDLADAQPHEPEKVRSLCDMVRRDLDVITTRERAIEVRNTCAALGY